MPIKPELVTPDTLRNILQKGQDNDDAIVRAYEAVKEATKDQDGKPLGKRFLTAVQMTIPSARYRHAASMTYLEFTMDGQDWSIFLSYTGEFRTAKLEEHNTPATIGAPERTAKRQKWLTDPDLLERLAVTITAYNDARYALQTWERESGFSFPDSLNLKGLRD